MKNIRNFSIIAHIDHGKSTLADRMLEITNTVEARKMREQVLDTMELEQERGITIKMQPVRMLHNDTILNLIDTPGHIDFSYEVSRALKAVEGSLLLVDATQGVQAQTFTTLHMAEESGLVIIPVLTKIDSSLARIDEVKLEVAELLHCEVDDILEVSGKTGEGVEKLLETIVKTIPEPKNTSEDIFRGLVFDFEYSDHRGIVVYTRVFDGKVTKGDEVLLKASHKKFKVLEVGTFSPSQIPCNELRAGEIGYIVTGIKEAGIASVGDTVASSRKEVKALPGYMQPSPVVWASIYPESQDDFNTFRLALGRLRLSDSSFTFEEETSGTLGRGFRCGFLGMLHLEIISERLRREFNLDLIVTTPSITYRVITKDGAERKIYSPHLFPNHGEIEEVYEPWVETKIIVPVEYISAMNNLFFEHEGEIINTENFGDRTQITVNLPLRELMRNFFDELKSVSSGYASLSYEMIGERKADVVRLDILVAGEITPALSRVVAKRRVEEEAEQAVEKLYELLPRQMFVVKIQGQALGRIISSKTLKALRKDVTAKLYGGDITRKMKLREKQKKGKKKMRDQGKISIPSDVFLKMMK